MKKKLIAHQKYWFNFIIIFLKKDIEGVKVEEKNYICESLITWKVKSTLIFLSVKGCSRISITWHVSDTIKLLQQY